MVEEKVVIGFIPRDRTVEGSTEIGGRKLVWTHSFFCFQSVVDTWPPGRFMQELSPSFTSRAIWISAQSPTVILPCEMANIEI